MYILNSSQKKSKVFVIITIVLLVAVMAIAVVVSSVNAAVDSATVTVNPTSTTRDSTINIMGADFTPIESVTVTILNSINRAVVDTFTVTTNLTGGFSGVYFVKSNFALGDYVLNATDTQGITIETSFAVKKINVNIALGSNTYEQGDVCAMQIYSTTKTAGTISIYDSNGTLFTQLTTTNVNNWILLPNGLYGYKMLTNTWSDPLLQIPSDAKLGTWTWSATFNDANESQTHTGTFTVNPHSATPTPTATSPPATVNPVTPTPPTTTAPPTETPTATEENIHIEYSPLGSIIVIIIVLIVVSVVALFFIVRQRAASITAKNIAVRK